uniref:Uncharacterized protein n=1 Tax=Avena sativa TaxID=4498 RepID=A0ACD5YUJ5_AVESA
MAQDDGNDNHNAPPATSSDSMSNGAGDGSNSSGRPVVVGAIDKGKGVVKTEGEDQGGSSRSKGKISTAHVMAAARDGRSGGRRGDRELHIATERERRKRMSEMFSRLHGLLPTLPDKVDKSSIVMEAIHYIKSLEGTLSELEKRKLEMQLAAGNFGAAANGGVSSSAAPPAPPPVVLPGGGIWPSGPAPAPPVTAPAPVVLQTWSGPNVVLSLSGNDACINVCVARRQGVLSMVMAVLEKHSIDVVTSGISSDNGRSMFTIHARINGASSRFGNNVPSEEIYKLAVSEIMVWLSE